MSGSPAIGAGTQLPVASKDIHGESRSGSTPDIGSDQRLDSDADTLPDWWEILYFGNLTKTSTGDNDSPVPDRLTNWYEYHFGFNPLLALSPGNVVSDLYVAVFLRKNAADYPAEWKTDEDNDDLTAGEELYYGSSPLLADSNGDGVGDGISLNMGISLISNDTDGDGISNAAELASGTNPLLTDTDGDGVADHLDAYPLDPGRTSFTPGAAGDTLAPFITLIEPFGAVLVP